MLFFYKWRSETTAFDQRYFQGRLHTNNSCSQPYFTRKVRWYSSRRLARNSASPPSEFSWQHSLHCSKRATKPLKNASVFGTKNLLAAIIGLQSPSKIALIKSCRLTSWFIKFIRLELHKLELDIRDARDTDTDFISCTIEEVISISRKYDLVNKQIDTGSRQLDWKLCDLIYLLVALIFCHFRRTIGGP